MLKIGKIIKVHGVHGHIIIDHTLKGAINTKSWDALLVELNAGSFIPFFIEEIIEHSPTSFRIKLEEISTPEAARTIVQKHVYASPNMDLNNAEVKTDVDSLVGYTLYDGEQAIGRIDNLLNPKLNPLFIINEDTKEELLIPANDELIISINKEEKKVIMDLPIGLV